MRRNEAARTAVEGSWGALEPRLQALADELSMFRDQGWSDDSGEVASVGAEVKDLGSALADALSEWLPEIPTHDELDALLFELASRSDDEIDGEILENAASTTAELLEFLRQISYGTLPSGHEAPDAQDAAYSLSRLLEALGVGA